MAHITNKYCSDYICPHGGDRRLYLSQQSLMSRNLLFLLSSVSQGEICLCTSRIYVEKSIYSEFLDKFVAAAKKWKTGDPTDNSNDNGALISKEHLEKVVEGSGCCQRTNPEPR